MIDLFTYGTLMHPPLMKEILGRQPAYHPGCLSGYQRYQVKNAYFPAVIPGPGEIDGVVYTGIREDELQQLDRYESDQYHRHSVLVRHDDLEIPCEVYVWKSEYRALLADDDWDFRAWVADYEKP